MDNINSSDAVKHATKIAAAFAREYRNNQIAPAHLLMALLHPEVGMKEFLKSIGKDEMYIVDWAEVRIEELEKTTLTVEEIPVGEAINRLFDEADSVRIKLGLDLITPVCLIAALSKPSVGFSADQLKSFPIREREIVDLFSTRDEIQSSVSSMPPTKNQGSSGALDKYCIDRLQLALEGKTDPIIGRDSEVRMVMEILGRRTKPNVIITGEPGVGKTALVDGFARDILSGEVPEQLKNIRLFELDLGALIAGASYKGEIEERLKNILREIKAFEKAVLFIDEIHTLIDSKGPIGSGAGNLLKPELARGEITLIGATTTEEYRKLIEPEKAFNRRFEVVEVNEPDQNVAVKMLEMLGKEYQQHHALKIMPGVMQECVRLAKRYMKDRRLPDSAFDLLDRSLAAIKHMNDTAEQQLLSLKESLDLLANPDPLSADAESDLAEYHWLHRLINNKISPVLLGQLDDKTQVDRFETSEEFHQYLKDRLSALQLLALEKADTLTMQDVAAVVSCMIGIPLGKIKLQEKDKLLNMEKFLRKRVIGQDHALKAVTDAILESRSGMNKKGQPMGSFFFLGPTGTGKTELAKSIASFLFNDEKAMIRFDMSEFKEEHSAALLYGAPPGYVGYQEGGMLVNKIRAQPYSVLLFDEIEKAHPSVFDTFLQILDEGILHDRLGKEGDFSNSLILFTSNIGSEIIAGQMAQGLIPDTIKLMELMSGHFRPEFLARLTEVVPFAPISHDNASKIFEIQLAGLVELLDKKGISIVIDDNAIQMLSKSAFDPRYGARQLAGVIRNELRRPISRMIISGTLIKGQNIAIHKNPNEDKLEWTIQ